MGLASLLGDLCMRTIHEEKRSTLNISRVDPDGPSLCKMSLLAMVFGEISLKVGRDSLLAFLSS